MRSSKNGVLKLLTFSVFLWALFFLNMILPKFFKNFVINPVVWNFMYLIFLVCALIATLVLIAESFKKEKPFI